MQPSTRRNALFGALYLSEGIPIGFLWWFLPERLARAEVPVERIAALVAILALPWTLKFLWAPLLDVLRGERFGYRAWMLACQAAMGLTLLPLAFLDLEADFALVYALCVAHACAAATQDVAIDALAVRTAPAGELGAINGWMQCGMLLGRATFGAAALRVGQAWGLAPIVVLMCVLIWSIGAAAFLAGLEEPPLVERAQGCAARPGRGAALRATLREFGSALRRALLRRSMAAGLLFAAAAGAGFEALGGLVSPFLVSLGLSTERIGDLLLFGATPGMVLGALVGGRIADRLGARRGVVVGQVSVVASVIAVALQTQGPAGPPLVAALLVFYIGIGLFVASSYALFMRLTDPGLAATQFTSFMAMTNLCEVWAVATAGGLIARHGYGPGFAAMAGVSLAALPLLLWLAPADRAARPKGTG